MYNIVKLNLFTKIKNISLKNFFYRFDGYYIVRTDEGQPRPKYIFNKCGTNINFFTLQKFGPSPSPNFKSNCIISICWQLGLHTSNFTSLGYLIQVKPMLETNLNV